MRFRYDPTSMTRVHWHAAALAAVTGAVHVYLYFVTEFVAFLVAGVIFSVAVVAMLFNVYRRALYALDDLALLFNVVHAHSPEENRALLERMAGALRPGGRVVVMDQFEGSLKTPALKAALGFLGLTYLVTLGADIYSPETVESWLTGAGFERVSRKTLASGVGFVSAERL